jgi:hypothetical protein
MDSSITQIQAVDRVMHVFEVLWRDVLNQQHLPRYVRAATIVLLANPGSTLVDMHRLFLDDAVRMEMLKNVTDQTVRQFWLTQYDELSINERLKRVQPLLSRLEALFMGRSLVRNIIGQRQTTIDFRKAIENKEIIFIKLPVKTLAQDARLIGTILVAKLHAAIFSFGDVPEKQRPGVSLYVDEFQNFATPDFAELFTEGRKFGVKVTVAHQYRSQLPDFLRASTMTARTKICFQLTPEDAREMAHLFHGQEEQVRAEDIAPYPIEYLLKYGSDNPAVQEFTDIYLRPVQSQRKGGKVEILYPGINPLTMFAKAKPNPIVEDPTLYLNNLLRQVMKTGDAAVPIPYQVMYGFANCGLSFYSAFYRAFNKALLLSPDVEFPCPPVIEAPSGNLCWTRCPDNSKEQMYHFLFFLRATMCHLAEEPVGKKTIVSPSEVASMLTRTPRRTAFVRSGEDVGVIHTHDTVKPVTSAELTERMGAIRQQTIEKYCRPRAEVEGQSLPQHATTNNAAESVPSRWEEV